MKWWFPLLLFALLAPFTAPIDMLISSLCYHDGHFVTGGWVLWMYRYGEQIGMATGVVALVIFLGSFTFKRWKGWRKGALAFGLTLFLGAGVLTNSVLKAHWGRPRPRQVVEFGGNNFYRPFYKPKFFHSEEHQRSFPSGHVAMGFAYVSLCLSARRTKSRWFYVYLALTLYFGVGLMVGRILCGAHFFTDTLVAALLMWEVAYLADRLVFRSEAKEATRDDACRELPDTSQAPSSQ